MGLGREVGGGGVATQHSLIWEGSSPQSKPLAMSVPYHTMYPPKKMVPLSHTYSKNTASLFIESVQNF